MSRIAASRARGVALLMALAAVVLVLAGLTAGLAAVRGARQTVWAGDVDGRLLTGLQQGERIALAWLGSGAVAVLPPEGGGLVLIDDRLLLPDGDGRISVVAYDGLAGIPAHLAQRGSAMRTALPPPMAGLVLPPIRPGRPERSSWLLDAIDLPDGVARYPAPPAGTGRVWRSAAAVGGIHDPAPPAAGPSLAGTIAFASDGRINVNTAPATVLRTAYAVLGLGGVDGTLERRRLLQPSPAPEGAPPSADGLRLVADSDRWAMLITVSWQDIHRGWWVEFAGGAHHFSLVRRHDASD